MAFQPRNIGTHNPHEPVVRPPALPSLIVPDNHEDIFRLDEPARRLDDERRPAQAVETDARRKRIERDARKARVARWIDNARPRYVPDAATSGRGLFTAFRRTTPCTHENEAVSLHEFLGALRATLGHNLAVPRRPGYVAVIADDAAIVAHVRNGGAA